MNIEDYFESDRFFNSLYPLKNIFIENETYTNVHLIEYLVDISIKYSILFGGKDNFSTNGLDEFMKNVTSYISSMDLKNIISLKDDYYLKEYVSKLYADELLKKLNLTRDRLSDEHLIMGLCSYVVRNLKGKDYIFHAFNSAMYESIKEYGINPNMKFTSQQEIDMINNIFEKYGITNIFGWQKLNCENKGSYSMTSSFSYSYGVRSPEWFSEFTGDSFPFNPKEEYKKEAFVEGDYPAAKNNLLVLMNKKQFSSEDVNSVLDFFDKNWKIYANKVPILAVIPGTDLEDTLVEDYSKYLLNDEYYKGNLERIIDFCLENYAIDGQTTETIDTSNAVFITLPKYSELIKKVTLQSLLSVENDIEKEDDVIDYNKRVRGLH